MSGSLWVQQRDLPPVWSLCYWCGEPLRLDRDHYVARYTMVAYRRHLSCKGVRPW